ncbi:MAG TPA: tyrosine--tRNA ligase [Polyangiaceae bacterium]
MDSLLSELEWRGYIYQQSNAEGLSVHLAEGKRVVYCGFDPTADSLTIGNLVAILLLRHFQRTGHRPVVVMGGATGLIGDPSGKESERVLRSPDEVERDIAGQRPIFERLLDFEGNAAARIVNNASWLGRLSFIDALREIGKHFSVNMMIQKESVRERLHAREQGISYTEFSYMLLQAYDFAHLYRELGVTMQAAGSDQWGNVVAGIDLVRRLHRTEVFGLTAPLITRSDGTKFGKTEAGAVWLTRERTSPYAFYQFWLNTADDDVERFLKLFTFTSRSEIEELLAEQRRDPGSRGAQRALAAHATELVHGKDALSEAEAATHALFSGEVSSLSKASLEELFANAPSSSHHKSDLHGEGISALELLVQAQVARSKREARELLSSGAVSFNGRRVEPDQRVGPTDLLHDSVLLIRRGKKSWHVTRWR